MCQNVNKYTLKTKKLSANSVVARGIMLSACQFIDDINTIPQKFLEGISIKSAQTSTCAQGWAD